MVEINFFETDEFADLWNERLQAGEVSRLIRAPQRTTIQQVIDEEREMFLDQIRGRALGTLDI
jgi:hypothetical protein